MNRRILTTLAITASLLAAAPLAGAKPFRWASQGEIPTWDPHSQNNALSNGIHAGVYESLVYYNSKFEVDPMLATRWEQRSPTQLRLHLRPNVKFHDGTPFSADDVVFSLDRARDPASNFTVYTQGIDRVVKVDDHTVDILTTGPNPVLLRQLTEVRIMSRAWAEKNNAARPMDMKTKAENFAHRNANGTGPFMLKEWAPDVRTVLVRNPSWWGRMEGNVTEMTYTPIKADATRVAALLSGEVDFILDPTPQDLPRLKQNASLKVLEGTENRTIFFGMDQFRDELPGSSVKGKNPLKDVRVRKALYQAIDIDAIHRRIMRGLSEPTGSMIAPQVYGWTEESHRRFPHDVEAAKQLLAQAGYPEGLELTMDCPNNRYINDEEICQAVVAMWARIGVKARLRTQPMATYFPMIQRMEASIYMLGWGVPTFDALYSLQSLVRSRTGGADGNYNVGRFSNPEIDKVIDRIKIETDELVRRRLIGQALAMHAEDVGHLPLHNQVIPWAMKKNVSAVHRADNRVDLRSVRIDD